MDPQWNRFLSQVRSGVIDIAHLVANVIDQDTRQWDIGKLSNLFEPATVNMILNIHLSDQLLHDQVFWCLSSSREFSLKSAYKAINSSNTQTHPLLQAKDWKEYGKSMQMLDSKTSYEKQVGISLTTGFLFLH